MSSLAPYYEEYTKTIEELSSIETKLTSGHVQYAGLVNGLSHKRKVEAAVQRREKLSSFFLGASLVALIVAGVFFVRDQEGLVQGTWIAFAAFFLLFLLFNARVGYLRTGVSSDYRNDYTDKIEEINDGLRDLNRFPSSVVILDATLAKLHSLKTELEQKRETSDRQQAEVEMSYA